jgi:hypothetical protein
MQKGMLRHVVLFQFKKRSQEQEIRALHQQFISLGGTVPAIRDFEWGLNDSPESLHQDFTHCYIVSFSSEEDRDQGYTPHPAHQAFVKKPKTSFREGFCG